MLESLHTLELEWIVQLQKLAVPEAVMKGLSNLGPSRYLLGLAGLIYLCFDARLGARLMAVYFGSQVVAGFAKLAFHTPRPFWVDDRIHAFEPSLASYGLPSGHALVATCVWLLLASAFRKRWVWAVAGGIVLLVGLSRVWLGSHFISDVVVGCVMGGVLLPVFFFMEQKCSGAWAGWSLRGQLGAIVGMTAGIVAVDMVLWRSIAAGVAAAPWVAHANTEQNIRSLGGIPAVVFGLGTGLAMASRWARFNAAGPVGKRLLRIVLVAAPGLAYWYRPRGMLREIPDSVAAGILFVSYSAAVWAFTFLLPRIFLKLGLAEPAAQREPPATPGSSGSNACSPPREGDVRNPD
jgi:membrane-associated phospholipid phosphatase